MAALPLSLKSKYYAKNALVYTLISLGLLFTAKVIFAQEQPRTITMVPPSTDRQLDAGSTTEGKLKLINDSNTALTFTASIKDFIVEDNQGTPKILPDNTLAPKYSAAAWVAVTPSSFTIPAGKSQEISYFVQVPSDARPGGRYAAVVYEPTDIINVKGTGAGVNTQLASLFYIRVNGPIAEKANVKRFFANPFQEFGPVSISTEITNSSDYHIRPKGNIVVKNLFGQVSASQPLEEHNIFPGADLVYTNNLGKKLMLGRYTVSLNATYGSDNNLPLTAVASFIVLPWKLAGIVALVIVVAILVILAMRRNKKNKPSQEAPPTPQPTQ